MPTSRKKKTATRESARARVTPRRAVKRPKTTPDTWLVTAKQLLITEGVQGVKLDRLARELGVTRSGVYYFFRSRKGLLDSLLRYWRAVNVFIPEGEVPSDPVLARRRLIDLVAGQIQDFDAQFDLAVREWGRSSPEVAALVRKVDAERMDRFASFFRAMGYSPMQSTIRARTAYYHQIGYYALNIRETVSTRLRNLPFFADVLLGPEPSAAAGRDEDQHDAPDTEPPSG